MASQSDRRGKFVGLKYRFAPSILLLEDRTVPATFFVDPALAGSADGSSVTFNAGKTGEVTGLRYESSVSSYAADVAANPGATYAFSDLRTAIDVSELNAGADTVRIAQSSSPIPLNNTPVTSAVTGGTVNSVTVTQPLSLIGSGLGNTVIAPTADTQFNDGTGAVNDALTAVVRVTDQAGLGVALTVSNLTLDGSGRQLGIGFSIENGATGSFTQAAVRHVIFTPTASTQGTAILGFLADSLTVDRTLVDDYGRVGVQFGNTNGSVTNSTVTGRGAGNLFNSGVDVYGDSTVVVSGNTITQNAGTTGVFTSDGVLAYADPDNATAVPTVTVIGNAIGQNGYGVAVGLPNAANTGDGSTVNAQYNNIVGNTAFGVFNQSGTAAIQAPNNNWGSASGPLQATTNPTGSGNAVGDKVVYQPFLTGPTPVAAGNTVADYRNAISTVTTTLSVPNATLATGGVGTVVVTFAQPVTGFTAADVTVTGSGVTNPPVTVTGSGASYTVTVSGLPANQPIAIQIAPQAATAADGSLTTGAAVTQTFTAPASTQLALSPLTAVGADAGGSPTVTVLNPDGTVKYSQVVFDSTFTGGVRTAVADFNGDGVGDIVAGTGVGISTQVRVFDGVTRAQIASFSPFEASFTLGVFVTVGDVTGDGVPDIIVTPDQGGGPRVVIYSGSAFTQVASFFGIDDPNFRGGARTAVGDFNNDQRLDLAVGAGFGGGPRVALFNGTTLTSGSPVKLTGDFFLFEQTLRNGTYLAAGDVNGDGFADLIGGGGPSGGPRVLILSGAGLSANQGAAAPVVSNFFAGDPTNRSGIRVAVKNLDGDAKADVVVGPGQGAGSQVAAYSGTSLAAGTPSSPLWTADPFGSFTGGVYVG